MCVAACFPTDSSGGHFRHRPVALVELFGACFNITYGTKHVNGFGKLYSAGHEAAASPCGSYDDVLAQGTH